MQKSTVKVPLLVLWSVLLAVFTAVLSAAPLRVVRTTVGQGLYWVIGVALSAALLVIHFYALAFVLGAQVILIGAFSEFEEHGLTLRHSAVLSVFVASLASASGFFLWSAFEHKNLFQAFSGWIAEFLKRAADMKIPIFAGLKPEVLVYQLPSALVIFLILSLALSLMLERPISRWTGILPQRKAKLSEYTNPDFFIWILILSLLGTFLNSATRPVQEVSLNILNISILAYFFQGLGVLGTYFEIFQIGFFWRLMWVLILVIQLPIVLSAVGVVDYWLEFRRFFMKKAAQLKKKRVQE